MTPNPMTRSMPSRTALSDAVFKTFVEGALLVALSVVHLAVDFPAGALAVGTIVLVVASLAADVYLFGSVGRAFAARRALHFKTSPLLVAGVLVFLLLPADGTADKIVRFALAAGIGGVVTALLNLGRGGRADA